MKLFVSSASPYARKCRIVAREQGLLSRIDEVDAVPLEDPPALRAANPLGKIPALVRDDGSVLADSKLIAAWFDSIGSGPSLYPDGEERWTALQRAALAEGVMDATVPIVVERRRPPGQQSQLWLDRWARAIDGALGALAKDPPQGFRIDAITLAAALEYLDFRLPDLDWRERHPALAAWHEEVRDRPSLAETRPA